MNSLGYPVFDADNHYYETADCFSRNIESKYAAKAITAVRNSAGEWIVKVGDKPYTYWDVKFDTTNPPGSLHDILRKKDTASDVKWGSSYSKENMLPAFQHRDARLALMDDQGVECAILLPTFAVGVEHCMMDDVEQTYGNLRSFNRWLEEEWGFGADGRIVAPPLLSLLDRDLAVAELDRVLAAGARLVQIRPGPTGGGKSLADPWYDPFWSRINEAGVPVAFHLSDNHNEEISAAWGEEVDTPVRQMSAFQWAFVHGDRPIMETFGALLYGNMFARFPNLRVLSIENGSDWVPYLLRLLDKKKGMGRFGKWVGGRPVGRPSATFREFCYVSPYPEDDVKALIECIGASHVLFGSDYPHPEGIADPVRFADLLDGCSDQDTRLVMRTNTERLLVGTA